MLSLKISLKYVIYVENSGFRLSRAEKYLYFLNMYPLYTCHNQNEENITIATFSDDTATLAVKDRISYK